MANKRLNAVITIGGTVTGSLKNALGSTQRGLRKIGDTVRSLEREQKALGRSMKQAADEGRSIGTLNRRYQSLTHEIASARREQERMTKAARQMDRGKSQIGEGARGLATVGAVSATVLVPIVQAAEFETAMLGVAKQVDGARDKGGKLTAVYFDMAKKIQHLGREIPIATNELAGMAEAGARMGVAKKDLIDFTRVSAEMSAALQLPTADLADDMGKIANLYKMPISAMRDMGDAINYLDDKSVAKGGEIIQFLRRTGGVAGSVKVTGKEMAALGSTLLSLGEPAESASTATNAMIQKFAAADKGTKKFHRALDEIGISAGQLQKGMQMDSQGTILKVIDAVNRMPKEKRLGILVDLVGLEHSDTLAKLVSGVGEYRKQIDLVNSQKVKGSMGREFQANLKTTNAQWEISKNRVREVAVNIGMVLLPAVNDFLGGAGEIVSTMADWTRENPKTVATITRLGGAVLASVAIWKTAKVAIGAAKMASAGFAIMQGKVATRAAVAATALNTETAAMDRQAISGKKLTGVLGILGKAIGAYMAVDLALEGARALGLPDVTADTEKQGRQEIKQGKWFKAIGHMTPVSYAKAMWQHQTGGDAPAKPGAPARAPGTGRAPPALPAPRRTNGGSSFTDNSKHTWHITQQPGQSAKSLADTIEARRKSGRPGSLLYDKPRGY